MCNHKIKYSENTLIELQNIYKSIKEDDLAISACNQEIDNKVQDILHYIELKVFNVPEGYFAVKELKDLLKDKRENLDKKKEILEMMNFFNGKVNFNGMECSVTNVRACNNQMSNNIKKKASELKKEELIVNYGHLLEGSLNSDSYAIALAEMIKQYNVRRCELKMAMSVIEKNMNSLLAKIEFSSFGLIEGFNYAKLIKELRIERRKIKDEFDRYKYLDAVLLNNPKITSTVEKVEKQEELKQTRAYNPRVLKSYGVMRS